MFMMVIDREQLWWQANTGSGNDWCHQATRHYLNQGWTRSMSSCAVTKTKWVNPCRAEFTLDSINIYLYVLLFVNIVHVLVQIIPCETPDLIIYLIMSTPLLIGIMATKHQRCFDSYIYFLWNIPVSATEHNRTRSRIYHHTSNISRTKSQNLNISRIVLQLSLPNPLKPGVKPRMKI